MQHQMMQRNIFSVGRSVHGDDGRDLRDFHQMEVYRTLFKKNGCQRRRRTSSAISSSLRLTGLVSMLEPRLLATMAGISALLTP